MLQTGFYVTSSQSLLNCKIQEERRCTLAHHCFVLMLSLKDAHPTCSFLNKSENNKLATLELGSGGASLVTAIYEAEVLT